MKRFFAACLLSASLFATGQVCDPNNRSLLFDGTSSYVKLPTNNQLNITSDLTIEAWIYPTAFGITSDMNSIVCKHGWTQGEKGYVLRSGGSGELSFNIAGVKTNGTLEGWKEVVSPHNKLHLNTWQHVAATYDGNKLRIYVDGVLVKTGNFKGTIDPSNYDLKIGRIADDGAANGRFFKGMIDEVRIWKRVLSANEISSHMSEQIDPQTATDLVGYWRFNETTGTNAEDKGTGNNDGVVMNANWNTDVPFTNGIPRPVITQLGGTLTSSALFGNQWNRDGVPIPGETGITFTPNSGGVYSVTSSYGLGCDATSETVEITMVGINDDHEQIQMSIYVRDNYLYFKNFAPLNKRMQFTLSDLSGREVIVLNENSFNDPIDVQSLAPGIYVVNIYSDDHFFKGKIFLN